MPRDLIELKKFNIGTITNASLTDVPLEAATNSLNVDPLAEFGRLRGIAQDSSEGHSSIVVGESNVVDQAVAPSDTVVFMTNSITGWPSSGTFSVKTEGVFRLYTYSSKSDILKRLSGVNVGANYMDAGDTAKLRTTHTANWVRRLNLDNGDASLMYSSAINRFLLHPNIYNDEGEPRILGVSNEAAWTSSNFSSVFENRALRIAMGNTEDTVPRWVGKTDVKQFGESYETTFIADAKLTFPDSVPYIHDAVKIGATFMYGIALSGNGVYKMNLSTGDTTNEGVSILANTRAICQYDASHILVLVEADGSYFLKKIAIADLETIVTTWTLPDYTGPDGIEYADIMYTGTTVWVSGYTSEEFTGSTTYKWLQTFDTGTYASGVVVLTDRTPRQSGSTSNGGWVKANTYFDAYRVPTTGTEMTSASNPIQYVTRLALSKVKSASTKVAFIARHQNQKVKFDDYGAARELFESYQYNIDGTNWEYRSQILYIVGTTYTPSSICPQAKLRNPESSYFDPATVTSGQELQNDFVKDGLSSMHVATGPGLLYYTDNKGSAMNAHLSYDCSLITTGGTNYSLGTLTEVAHDSAVKIPTSSTTKIYRMQASGPYGVAEHDDSTLTTTWTDKISGSNISIGVANAGTGSDFDAAKYYHYKYSILYEYQQETPLTTSSVVPAQSVEHKDISVDIADISLLDKRISHILVYRASSDSTSVSDTYYRLVKAVSLNDGNWVTNGTGKDFDFGDTLTTGASYEARNGISELITDTSLHYKLNCELFSEHIVADAWHSELGAVPTYLFKSKPFQYDVFDWSTDFVKLPHKPNALVAFGSRVYAISRGHIMRINTQNMALEDVDTGCGTAGQHTVTVTDKGFYFMDNNGVYFHNGREAVRINDNIAIGNDGNAYPWQYYNIDANDRIFYHPHKKQVICFATNNVWAGTQMGQSIRWDRWEQPASWDCLFYGKDREVLFMNGAVVGGYAQGSTKRDFAWTSGNITAGQDSQDKIWQRIRFTGDSITPFDNDTVTISVDGTSVTTDDTEVGLLKLDSGGVRKGKAVTIDIDMAGDDTAAELDSIGIVFRRRYVK